MNELDNIQLLPARVADYLGIAPATLRQWANKGLLPYTTTVGGHRRYMSTDVERFAEKFGMLNGQTNIRKILIVDDEQKLADYLAQKIRNHATKPEVLAVYGGIEAGFTLTKFAPDIVILDLMMPGVNGVEVANLITAHHPKCMIIGITGFKNTPEEQQFIAAGAKACIYKPIDLDEMFMALDLHNTDVANINAKE
ncbi:MAG: response regulator [Pseudomonadales bacterium]|nr:response regulator [Pseudomonadales bacterium]